MRISPVKDNCCGCQACGAVCPTGAISFVTDGLGFLMAHVDETMCIDCSRCVRACGFNRSQELKNAVPATYALRQTNPAILSHSQSGGAFTAISDAVLAQQGTVYGAVLGDDMVVRHTRATRPAERDLMRGSKYVQSDIHEVFPSIISDLKDGLLVAFFGTGCQAAAIKVTVPAKLQEKLLIVDLVCHGVASPRIFADYLAYLGDRQGSKVTKFNFRDKQFGWHSHCEMATFANGLVTHPRYILYDHTPYRDSCYTCPFTDTKRVSDITIGDIWGIEHTEAHDWNDDKGVSLVLVNTLKGQQIFSSLVGVKTIPVSLTNCLQPQLQHPTPRPGWADTFEKLYARKGFAAVHQRFGPPSLPRRAISKISRTLKKIIR